MFGSCLGGFPGGLLPKVTVRSSCLSLGKKHTIWPSTFLPNLMLSVSTSYHQIFININFEISRNVNIWNYPED